MVMTILRTAVVERIFLVMSVSAIRPDRTMKNHMARYGMADIPPFWATYNTYISYKLGPEPEIAMDREKWRCGIMGHTTTGWV